MYEVKLTDEALEMTSNPNDLIHIPMWIVQIYDMETALICSLIDREWIEKVMKKVLEKNLEVVTNLWRSLWHRFQKARTWTSSKNNGTARFLE